MLISIGNSVTKNVLRTAALAFIVMIQIETQLMAQSILTKAKSEFALRKYAIAEPLFEKAFTRKKTLAAARGAAECARKRNNYVGQEFWYSRVVGLPNAMWSDSLNYAESLIGNSKYAAAETVLKSLKSKEGDLLPEKTRKLQLSCDSSANWLSSKQNVRLIDLPFNSPFSEWGGALINGHLFYVSDGVDSTAVYPWTGHGFGKLSAVATSASGNNSFDKLISMLNETGCHVGPICFSNDKSEAFYVRARKPKRNRRKVLAHESVSVMHTELIHVAFNLQQQQWVLDSAFSFNNPDKYSIGDPYLTSSGDVLFFSSDLESPDSHGGVDLYYSLKDQSGKWCTPVNMGPEINTSGDERTPFMANDSVLYFASDGRPGLGGLDIYKAKFIDGKWHIVNMGCPYNSSQDDFSFCLHDDTSGYLSSNRIGGVGADDVYAVQLITKNEPPKFDVPELIRNSDSVTLAQLFNSIAIGTPVRLKNVYFDFNRYDIKSEAFETLRILAKLMGAAPDAVLEICSYTDCRGSSSNNLTLSIKRSEAIVNFLLSEGISSDRLIPVGYGETRPTNGCVDGVVCSEMQYQQNRRSEFVILKK